MKKFKYIVCLLLIVASGILQKGYAQNHLDWAGVSPSGIHCDGDLVTVRYNMDFTMHQDTAAQIRITFDDNYFDFLSTDISSSTSGIFNIASNTAGDVIIRSNIFNSIDNNYSFSSSFTITFRLKSYGCSPTITKNITTILSSIHIPTMFETDMVQVLTPVEIKNCASTNSLMLELYKGSDCGTAIYKITSYGYESSTNISRFKLFLPNGATVLYVYNSSGNTVTATQTGNIVRWDRSGIAGELLQVHYVMVKFNALAMCTNPLTNSISLEFNSMQICDPSTPVTSTVSRSLDCCNSGTSGTGPGTPGSVVIPDAGGAGGTGGVVFLTKTLVQTPFRYFPKPNNCQTHDYYVTVDNFTNQYLTQFVLGDDLETIIPGISSEIKLKDVGLSLTSLFPGAPPVNFTCDVITPQSNPGSLLATLSSAGSSQTLSTNYGWTPPITGTETLVKLIGNGSSFKFPPMSSLTLKLTHYLENSNVPPMPPGITYDYDNYAKLRFNAAGVLYTTAASWKSKIDTFPPILKVEKFVRDSTTNSAFNNCVPGNPGDTVQFLIKIRNYGITDALNVNFADTISNPFGSFYQPYLLNSPTAMAFSVTDANGTYTQTELDYIKHSLVSSINGMTNNVFGMVIPNVKAAPCLGYSEIVISYYVIIKNTSLITCDSVYTNKATIKWDWQGDIRTDSSKACVNIDMFENISQKLEWSCTPNGPWSNASFNAYPSQRIYFKASVRNYNAFPVNNYKMIVQLPNGTSNSSTQNNILNFLNSVTPPIPAATGLYPTGTPVFSTGFSYSNVTNNLEHNWLAGSTMTQLAMPAPAHRKSIIGTINLPAFTGPSSPEFFVTYDAIIPVNNVGTCFTTEMGVSAFTNPGGCKKIRKKSLTVCISNQPSCGTAPSTCDLIKFDTLITRLPGNRLKVDIFNILDMNGTVMPNINNIDVVVHQPYHSCVSTLPSASSPYNRLMVNYTLMNTPPVSSTPYTHSNPAIDERIIKLNNTSAPGIFGRTTFFIQLGNMPQLNCGILPINIVFKDNNTPCTLCEKMIYLKF